MTVRAFPSDWHSAVVFMPHPDDPEYGMSAAVAKWTSAGRTVRYVFACRGEAGIEGMAPDETARVREAEQRRAAAIVGVHDVDFWDVPDSNIRDTAELRARIAGTITALKPDVVVTIYGGPQWAPEAPNQRDHMEFSAATLAAYDQLSDPPRWLFSSGPGGTYLESVDGFVDVAIESLAAHDKYLSVIDPETPVIEQARRQVGRVTPARPDFGGHRVVEFILERSTGSTAAGG
ncbi:PIG-L family deacetylase [Mycobacterium sp.]|jgi:LmbE family N-acetylglucosaminyl deacetylase|uniref:PIG-L deacetylase family protein n=1 Tax=Mycobacterium sp. TaxID=1785 RepID=UPI002D2C6162|nr:PIG-L family deacetylase [Mycobacterium sp.]HZA10679.1 PIG-L family deacetylase [Mycobacterium sp.]